MSVLLRTGDENNCHVCTLHMLSFVAVVSSNLLFVIITLLTIYMSFDSAGKTFRRLQEMVIYSKGGEEGETVCKYSRYVSV